MENENIQNLNNETQETGTEAPQVDTPIEDNVTDAIADELSETEPTPVEENKETPPQEVKEDKIEDKPEEQEDFDPNDISFDDEEEKKGDEETPIYKDIEGYDLEAFKDILDFENEEALSIIKDEVAELKKNGFSQAQVEYFINYHLKNYNEEIEEDKKYNSKEYVMQNLKEHLSQEEKRNYKAINSLMNEITADNTIDKDVAKTIMSSPQGVKILNVIYKKMTNTNTVLETPAPKPKMELTPTGAFERYKEWILKEPKVTKEKTVEFIKGLQNQVAQTNMPEFEEIFRTFLK